MKQWNMRLAGILALLATGVALSPTPSLACTCMAHPEDDAAAAAKAYADADVVFLGTVTDIKAKRFRFPQVRDATFAVQAIWKGEEISRSATIVRSVIGELGCGYRFRKSVTYVVFAHWNFDQEILWTNMCAFNHEESEARTVIEALDRKGRREIVDEADPAPEAPKTAEPETPEK